MTESRWLATHIPSDLYAVFCELSDRKLHLLTAAFLRRVWDRLPSESTRTAVEATERYADGRITAKELGRLRSIDLLETCEPFWMGTEDAFDVELLIRDCDCLSCDRVASEVECRVAREGDVLGGVLESIEAPAWIAVQAAFLARDLVASDSGPEDRDGAVVCEMGEQFALFREITGAGFDVHPKWPLWRTTTVRLLARGIYRHQAFDRLPILADALQDAGCNDEAVLTHGRGATTHLRGCWVVDLALGIG
jgi:hypothetical protein